MGSLREAFKLDGGGIISLVGAGGKTSLMNALAEEFDQRGESVLITTTTKIKKPADEQCPVLILGKDPTALIERCRAALRKNNKLTAATDCPDPRNKLVGFPPEVVDELWHSGLFKWIVVEADGAARKPLKAPAQHEPVIPAASRLVIGIIGLSAIGRPLSERWVFRPEIFASFSGLLAGEPVTPAATATVLSHPSGLMKGAPAKCTKMVFLNQADLPEHIENGREIATVLARNPRSCARVVIGRMQPEAQVIDCIDIHK